MTVRTPDPRFEDLPFVRPLQNAVGRRFNAWHVEPTGDWRKDNDTGETYARALLDYMTRTGRLTILTTVLREIFARPELDGIAVGFLFYLASVATERQKGTSASRRSLAPIASRRSIAASSRSFS